MVTLSWSTKQEPDIFEQGRRKNSVQEGYKDLTNNKNKTPATSEKNLNLME